MACNYTFEDLKKGDVCGNSTSGVKKIIYGLVDDVAKFPTLPTTQLSLDDYVETIGDIIMKNGKRAYEIYSKLDAAELKYTLQGEEGGKSQKASLEIYHPGFKKKILGFITAAQNANIFVLCKLNNGEWHLLGDEDRGAIIESAEATSGKATADANGASITFNYDTPHPQVYTGDTSTLLTTNAVLPTFVLTETNIGSTDATLSASINDPSTLVDTNANVKFYYKKEGNATWKSVSATMSNNVMVATISNLTTASDYIYYAVAISNGNTYKSDEYSFTTN